MSPRRVLLVLGPSAGGIRQHVAVLADALEQRGWTVRVAGPPGVMDGLRRLDAEIDVPASKRPDRLLRAAGQLRRVRGDAEVIHAHGFGAAAVSRLARLGRPLVVTVHNLVIPENAGRFHAAKVWLARQVLSGCDRVIVISPEIDAEVATVVPDERRRYVLPMSAERSPDRDRATTREALGIAEDIPLVVVVARINPQKDLDTFLRAMAAVRDRLPQVRAIVVGDGEEAEATTLEALRQSLRLGSTVEFVGRRTNPADEMMAADVVALSSAWEGSPIAVVEALRLGRPLVSTAVGTVPYDLTDGVDARVVPIGDPAALGTAIVEVLTDPVKAEAMAQRGRKLAERIYEPDRLVGQIVDVYGEVLMEASI